MREKREGGKREKEWEREGGREGEKEREREFDQFRITSGLANKEY